MDHQQPRTVTVRVKVARCAVAPHRPAQTSMARPVFTHPLTHVVTEGTGLYVLELLLRGDSNTVRTLPRTPGCTVRGTGK